MIGAVGAARRLVALAPDNPVLRTVLARAGAVAGDTELAGETLEWLAVRGYGLDESAQADLAGALKGPRNASLRLRLAGNLAQRGSSRSVVAVGGGLDAEGVTYDPQRNSIYLANEDGLFAVRRDGSTDRIVAPGALKERYVLGVRYDARRDRVFVCASSKPGAENPTAELVVINLGRPAGVDRFELAPSAQPRLCNDIAVLSDGAALTDTNTGEVFRFRDGAGILRFTAFRFAFPNGVVQAGDRLIVADFLGLWALSLDGRLLGQMRTPAGDYLGGIDGLAVRGSRIVGVQNLTTPERVVSFRVGDDLVLGDAALLIAGAPELAGMTTATFRGSELVVLSSRAEPRAGSKKALVELRPASRGIRIRPIQ